MKTVVFPKLLAKNFLFFNAIFALFLLILFLFALSPFKERSSSLTAIFDKGNFTQFSSFVEKDGVEKAYQLLKMRFPKNEAAAHDFAHVIGLSAFKEKGNLGLAICDTAYNYGCYHGFIESFLTKNGVEKVGQIEESCISLGRVHAPSCLHGIGHGVMIHQSYKLEEALKDCDRLMVPSRIYCWDGVFMERITGSMLSPVNRPQISKNNLDEPCVKIAKIYKEQCFRNQVTLWFSFFSGETKSISAQCARIEKEYQRICFESIGLINVIQTGEERERLVELCRLLNNEASDFCLFGEIKELLFEGKSPKIAEALCSFVTLKNREKCSSIFIEHLKEQRVRLGV